MKLVLELLRPGGYKCCARGRLTIGALPRFGVAGFGSDVLRTVSKWARRTVFDNYTHSVYGMPRRRASQWQYALYLSMTILTLGFSRYSQVRHGSDAFHLHHSTVTRTSLGQWPHIHQLIKGIELPPLPLRLPTRPWYRGCRDFDPCADDDKVQVHAWASAWSALLTVATTTITRIPCP
jgi:hypothetical protein